MASAPDFEFGLGGGRHLRGRDWRGLIALAMLLTAIMGVIAMGTPWLAVTLKNLCGILG
jgi:hypothetical protein